MPKILIADDDINFFNSLSETLIATGFETLHAKNSTELIQKASTNPPDIILLDVTMETPEDGLKAGKELFQKGITIPVIILDNVANVATLSTDTAEIAVEAYAEKPIDTDKIIKKINTILSR